jgi:homospermidine synthase
VTVVPPSERERFDGRLLVIGCGSVSQCTLPLLLDHLDMEPSRITVLEMADTRARIADVLARGVNWVSAQVTQDNLGSLLGEHVGPGDMIVDVAWNIDAVEILQWCHDHGVRYVNTSVELWDPYAGGADKHPLERTLYVRHMALRDMVKRWGAGAATSATAVVEHGANPGLVSHFTKEALLEIAERVVGDGLVVGARREAVDGAVAERDFARMAMALGVKVIHIAERDTQISNEPKRVNEFVNTWSVEGFYEEGIAPAEMGWGTHEKTLPPGAQFHQGGPGNQICLAQPGVKTWVRSWTPVGEITGMVVRHGESFTMSDHLTVWDDAGRPVYRPTVHYAYCPADVAINSLHELEMRQYDLQVDQRILNDEIVSGRDDLGVLLMGHDLEAWWCGSRLSIEEARAILPHQNATTMQVAASIVGAVLWMIRNPEAGLRVPDDVPHDEVLPVAKRYLGTWFSEPVAWNPLRGRVDLYRGWNQRAWDPDPWQFSNFLV